MKDGESVKLSTSARYGLRAMSDLCVNSLASVSDIASRQNIPAKYLDQLLAKLRRAGLLESIRGAQGGYKLARASSEITISEILAALGEPVIWGECQTEKGCGNAPTCPTFNLWRRVKNSVDDILSSTTLESIAKEEISPDPERQQALERSKS